MKTAVITGAGRGIGLALVKEFVSHGYQVIGTIRDEKAAKELLKLAKDNPSVRVTTLEVTDEDSFGPLEEVLKKSGPIDVLINNSGIIGNEGAAFEDLDMDLVVATLLVNSVGPMRVARLVLPFMKDGGVVAQITSLMGSISDSSGGYYDYRMSKTALNMFNHALSKEYTNLTCLALHPGWVKTDMGGESAPTNTKESASGLYKVITTADPKLSGSFMNFKGQVLPW